MTLKVYKQKRDFTKTPEPKGKVTSNHSNLFIIQKHAASRLHYDFRLELQGVLKSWAIPKGPCLDPTVKRLAVHVEDHPVEYGSFEGIIPKGEYGGGTVMLWDQGIWLPLMDDPMKAYQKGHLSFELKAKKLKGRWDLIRFKDSDNSWFLVKYKDKWAKPLVESDITLEKPNSVLTNQSLEDIKKNYEHTWTRQEGKGKAPAKKSVKNPAFLQVKKQLVKASFPRTVTPQLCTLVDKVPPGDEWLHEIKLDGYRMIAFKKGNQVHLFSRNHIEWTVNFPNLIPALKKLPVKNVVIDGEVVLLDEQQHSNFQLLQNSMKSGQQDYYLYYLFDVLYYEGYDLRNLPLIERKAILQGLLPISSGCLRYSDHMIGQGASLFEHVCQLGLEGIISKKKNGIYQEKRGKTWLKVKCSKRQEFVIGGFSKPKGGRSHFGSLFLGVYEADGSLSYCGNVGTGFSEASLKEVNAKLQQNLSSKNPFSTRPPGVTSAIWVKPKLIAEVEFSQWTEDGRLRHPSFKGLRTDKKAKDIVRESIMPIEKIDTPDEKSRQKKFNTRIKLSNPKKILYPEDGITKEDLYHYYDQMSAKILPYIINRPLTLVRCPNSYEDCFFQKQLKERSLPGLYPVPIETKNVLQDYIYIKDKTGLLTLVQMGALELHPWGSHINHLEYPDLIIIDLDPGLELTWEKVVSAAHEIREYLNKYQLQSFVKTTGGKGLHVVVPIQPEYDWDEVKHFTHVFVEFLEKRHPEDYISNMAKAKRKGKIFVDYLRNQRGATAIAPYSSRARLHAPVATPLAWEELSPHYEDNYFTIFTLPERLQKMKKDPWARLFKIKQTLPLS